MGDDVKNDSGSDIPFDDRPGASGRGARTGAGPGGRPAGAPEGAATQVPHARGTSPEPGGEASGRAAGEPGAGRTSRPAGGSPERPRAPRTEDRDQPGPGSTGPTGMREDLGTLAEEAVKLWSALEARFIAPAVRAYPDVTRHLGAAGRELLSAYRSAVGGQEQAWRDAGSGPRHEKITVERVDPSDPAGPEDRQKNRD